MSLVPLAIRPPQRATYQTAKPHLRDLDRPALATFVHEQLGGPRYRAEQIFEWIHGRGASSFDEMTNLPQRDRARLAERSTIEPLGVDATLLAADGTRKLRLRTGDGASIESVLIPNEGRGYTQCVSSMVGCSLTCAFCATASLGFVRNLTTWEIVDQVYRAQQLLQVVDVASARTDGEMSKVTENFAERPQRRDVPASEEHDERFTDPITNLVFMGMGEPLHNYNHVVRALGLLTDASGAAIAGRRITVSTAGFVPGIRRFAADGLAEDIGLAVSLNAANDELRSKLMPINTRWPLAELLAAVRDLPAPKRRHLTFEYVLLKDVNDREQDTRELQRLLRGIDCQLNVIPFNPHPHAPFTRPSDQRIGDFVAACRGFGIPTYLRTPRGDDIAAACGQLALEAR